MTKEELNKLKMQRDKLDKIIEKEEDKIKKREGLLEIIKYFENANMNRIVFVNGDKDSTLFSRLPDDDYVTIRCRKSMSIDGSANYPVFHKLATAFLDILKKEYEMSLDSKIENTKRGNKKC